MSRSLQQSNSKSQLRWVILLLAIAVILPTVCLLWFMTQAVRNERLAVRQKLIDIYQEKAKPLIQHLQQSRLKFEQRIQQIDQVGHFSFFVEVKGTRIGGTKGKMRKAKKLGFDLLLMPEYVIRRLVKR